MKRSAPISFRIEPDLKEALLRLAKSDSRSLSAMIELILKRYVAAECRKPKKAK